MITILSFIIYNFILLIASTQPNHAPLKELILNLNVREKRGELNANIDNENGSGDDNLFDESQIFVNHVGIINQYPGNSVCLPDLKVAGSSCRCGSTSCSVGSICFGGTLCILIGNQVSCGGHSAASCSECGAHEILCNGDCKWNGVKCTLGQPQILPPSPPIPPQPPSPPVPPQPPIPPIRPQKPTRPEPPVRPQPPTLKPKMTLPQQLGKPRQPQTPKVPPRPLPPGQQQPPSEQLLPAPPGQSTSDQPESPPGQQPPGQIIHLPPGQSVSIQPQAHPDGSIQQLPKPPGKPATPPQSPKAPKPPKPPKLPKPTQAPPLPSENRLELPGDNDGRYANGVGVNHSGSENRLVLPIDNDGRYANGRGVNHSGSENRLELPGDNDGRYANGRGVNHSGSGRSIVWQTFNYPQ